MNMGVRPVGIFKTQVSEVDDDISVDPHEGALDVEEADDEASSIKSMRRLEQFLNGHVASDAALKRLCDEVLASPGFNVRKSDSEQIKFFTAAFYHDGRHEAAQTAQPVKDMFARMRADFDVKDADVRAFTFAAPPPAASPTPGAASMHPPAATAPSASAQPQDVRTPEPYAAAQGGQGAGPVTFDAVGSLMTSLGSLLRMGVAAGTAGLAAARGRGPQPSAVVEEGARASDAQSLAPTLSERIIQSRPAVDAIELATHRLANGRAVDYDALAPHFEQLKSLADNVDGREDLKLGEVEDVKNAREAMEKFVERAAQQPDDNDRERRARLESLVRMAQDMGEKFGRILDRIKAKVMRAFGAGASDEEATQHEARAVASTARPRM